MHSEEKPESVTDRVAELKPNLVNIIYPAFVQNVDRALDTLGGLQNIETVVANTQKKQLELFFRPRNCTSMPLLGERDAKPHMLVRIKTRKDLANPTAKPKVVGCKVVGMTAVNIAFESMWMINNIQYGLHLHLDACDFQFLPLMPNKLVEVEKELNYVYNDVIPETLPDNDWLMCEKEENEEIPPFFTPQVFTRLRAQSTPLYFDRTKHYEGCFNADYLDKFRVQHVQQKMARGSDQDKYIQRAMLCRFEDDVPMAPNPQIVAYVKQYKQEVFDKVKEMFAERPIWSRHAVLYHSKGSQEHMKFIMPAVAYHYVSGPWRSLWVRYGYDPKTDAMGARLLQSFDLRTSHAILRKAKTIVKVGDHAEAEHDAPGEKKKKFTLREVTCHAKQKKTVEENWFALREGMLPASRQSFYQYCDLKLPDIERMIAKLPDVGANAECHWKHGWLPNGFADQCRELVGRYLIDTLAQQLSKTPATATTESSRDADEGTKLEQRMTSIINESDSSDSDSDLDVALDLDEERDAKELDEEAMRDINAMLTDATLRGPQTIKLDEIYIDPQPGPSWKS